MLVQEHLLQALDDLLDEDFKKFKWYLPLKILDNCPPIKKAHLQGVSRDETVVMMIERYGEKSAVNLTLEILKRMNFNGTAEELRTALAGAQTATPSTSSSAVAPPAAAPAAMMAQQGGVIIAPTFSDSSVKSMNITITK